MQTKFALHTLGWQAFQDLCVALVEEQCGQSVQTFLPSNDAGRDGAFRGSWDRSLTGHSTIQCKFTSKENHHLSLSSLSEELPKAEALAKRGLATDYVILTNCVVTGASELKIRQAFEARGVGCCRVFHRDWIAERIANSARLRMMVPRLYGMIDLTALLDSRAYTQAKLILSQMGESLSKLVLTSAHRKSVAAINEHGVVLLLGSPAAGKSTIGASLALGASDMWNLLTIKVTSPEQIERHVDPDGGQFFWIDDAFGSTQYQRDRTESWNQVFPLMQGAMRKGTKFLFTSRDYIWAQARSELKTHALPALMKSSVVINVQEFSIDEKARILYNHIKFGDQSTSFKSSIRAYLPELAGLHEFLPESARRLGSRLFTDKMALSSAGVRDFFCRPKDFLEQTIVSMSVECRAAIALIFQNGGRVRSPVPIQDIESIANDFGVGVYDIKSSLEFLRGSLLMLVSDDDGCYWTYHHPTVSDAFASYLASAPELIEIYIRGGKPEFLASEVICAGAVLDGASVVVPVSLQPLLASKFAMLDTHRIRSFISYRASKSFTDLMVGARPDLLEKFPTIIRPLKSDQDIDFLLSLERFGLLSEGFREDLIDEARDALLEEADDSLFSYEPLREILSSEERIEFHIIARDILKNHIDDYVEDKRNEWSEDYEPRSHFEELNFSLLSLAKHNFDEWERDSVVARISNAIESCINDLKNQYEESTDKILPQQHVPKGVGSLVRLFRDVHE